VNGVTSTQIIVQLEAEGDQGEELSSLHQWLEAEATDDVAVELRQAPEGEHKAVGPDAVLVVIAGHVIGGVAEAVTASVLESVRAWWADHKVKGRTPPPVCLRQDRHVIAKVPDEEDGADAPADSGGDAAKGA
jgi:hypothetical protein